MVRINKRGGVTVGRHAGRYLENDPANTHIEFKRLMGTESPLAFPASGVSHMPEELSARVLLSLLSDASDMLGFIPTKAVISTPALFELPQNHATMRAGKLAGLEKLLLIQEPIASAIAAGRREDSPGLWLIFDLGGGTLDISLLETRDGRLRVMDHSGDNFLGGKDFDNALMDWALDRLRQEYTLPEVMLHREDGATIPARAVGQEGSFVLPAALRAHCQNRFRLAATDADGKEVPLSTPEFAIVHGISIADPPLSRSVGVALAADTVQVYLKKAHRCQPEKHLSTKPSKTFRPEAWTMPCPLLSSKENFAAPIATALSAPWRSAVLDAVCRQGAAWK